jgi:hypothetical protein
LAQKIAEREAEELAKKEEAAAKKRLDAQLASETPEQRKARENKMIIESDLENAKELFATLSVSAAPSKFKKGLVFFNKKRNKRPIYFKILRHELNLNLIRT